MHTFFHDLGFTSRTNETTPPEIAEQIIDQGGDYVLALKDNQKTTHQMVESERQLGEQVPIERRYSLSSLPSAIPLCAKAVRERWGIENSVHWVLVSG